MQLGKDEKQALLNKLVEDKWLDLRNGHYLLGVRAYCRATMFCHHTYPHLVSHICGAWPHAPQPGSSRGHAGRVDAGALASTRVHSFFSNIDFIIISHFIVILVQLHARCALYARNDVKDGRQATCESAGIEARALSQPLQMMIHPGWSIHEDRAWINDWGCCHDGGLAPCASLFYSTPFQARADLAFWVA